MQSIFGGRKGKRRNEAFRAQLMARSGQLEPSRWFEKKKQRKTPRGPWKVRVNGKVFYRGVRQSEGAESFLVLNSRDVNDTARMQDIVVADSVGNRLRLSDLARRDDWQVTEFFLLAESSLSGRQVEIIKVLASRNITAHPKSSAA